MCFQLSFHQFLERFYQFIELLIAALFHIFGNAGLDVIGKNHFREAVERAVGGRHLIDDINTVGVFLEHALDSPYLTFDSAQSVHEVFDFFIAADLLVAAAFLRFLYALYILHNLCSSKISVADIPPMGIYKFIIPLGGIMSRVI